MAVLPPSSVAAGAACAVLAYLLLRAVLAVLKFRRYELAFPGPPTLPILGNALSFVFLSSQDVADTLIKLWGYRRDLCRISIVHNLVLIVSKPEDVGAVLKRKDLLDKPYFFYSIMAEKLPSGLLQMSGPNWKTHRVASTPAFHPEIIDSFVDVFAEEAEKFSGSVEPYKDFLIEDKLFSTTLWSICRSVMMSDKPTKEQEEGGTLLVKFLQFWLETVIERSLKPLLWSEWVYSKTKKGRIVKRDFQKVRQFVQQIMEARANQLKERKELEDTDFFKARKTLLDTLLQANSNDEQEFTKDDVLDELTTFLGAATETSVSTLNFTFKMMSLRPDIQQKVYEEVSSLLGSGAPKRSIVAQDLPKLEYTERVIKETMRLFAPVPVIARQVNKDTELLGHQIQKGTTIGVNFFGLHRDPVTWPDPLRFDPDRFLPEQSEGRHPYAFLPFSAGPRNCIGYRYAWAVVKSVVATTIRDFVVEPADDGLTDHTQFKVSFYPGLKLNGGVRVKLIPRKTTARPA